MGNVCGICSKGDQNKNLKRIADTKLRGDFNHPSNNCNVNTLWHKKKKKNPEDLSAFMTTY